MRCRNCKLPLDPSNNGLYYDTAPIIPKGEFAGGKYAMWCPSKTDGSHDRYGDGLDIWHEPVTESDIVSDILSKYFPDDETDN